MAAKPRKPRKPYALYVELPPDLREWLDALVERTGRNRRHVAIEALRAYRDAGDKPPRKNPRGGK
jgi:predicted transcriptional regulator